MHACTIAAVNYLAKANVLTESFLREHPGRTCTLLLVADTVPDWVSPVEGLDVVCPTDIGITLAQLHEMALMYDVTEVATALKPHLLLHLLGRHERVVYLDPDMEVLADLTPVDAALDRASIALTPHFRTPPKPWSGLSPSEHTMMEVGTFNLGFIAVGRGAEDFLRWWDERLRYDCVVSAREQLFVDQRWINMAVGYWDVTVIRDPGVNLAYWNLDEVAIGRSSDGRMTAGDVPVRLFHFSGLPGAGDERWTTHVPDVQRQPLGDPTVLHGAFDRYRAAADGHRQRLELDRRAECAYPFATTASGRMLGNSERRFVRSVVKSTRGEATGATLPDPFDPATVDAYERWLRAQRPARVRQTGRDVAQGLHTSFPHLEDQLDRVLGGRAARRIRSAAIG